MKNKKALAAILAAAVLAVYPLTGAFARVPIADVPADLPKEEIVPISAPLRQTSYLSFSGTIKEIEVRSPSGSGELKYVFAEGEDEQVAYLVLSKDTFIFNEEELAPGAKITGFYAANKPMILIYPPQYPVEAVVINAEDNIKLDYFDEHLISSDGMLKLNISAKTGVIDQDGAAYEGALENHKLLVFYGVSTRSIPAQTSPDKIIVLSKEPIAYLNKDNIPMIALREAAEKSALELVWNKELQQVTLSNNITLTIGQEACIAPDSSTIRLEAAPELRKGKTYVPYSFLSHI